MRKNAKCPFELPLTTNPDYLFILQYRDDILYVLDGLVTIY